MVAGIVQVFISHSSADEALAAALEGLIEAAFEVSEGTVRCTITATGAHPRGSRTSVQLRQDLKNAKVFLVLMTPSSRRSDWVLLEIGGAWVLDLPTLPILAGGVTLQDLPAVISDINSVRAERDEEVWDLIEFIGKHTDLVPRTRQAKISKAVKTLVEAAGGIVGAEAPRTPSATRPQARDYVGTVVVGVDVSVVPYRARNPRPRKYDCEIKISDLLKGLILEDMIMDFKRSDVVTKVEEFMWARWTDGRLESLTVDPRKVLAELVDRGFLDKPSPQKFRLNDEVRNHLSGELSRRVKRNAHPWENFSPREIE